MLIDSVDTNKSVREKFLKRLQELSLKSLGQVPQLAKLNEEQSAWTKNKMKRGWCTKQ